MSENKQRTRVRIEKSVYDGLVKENEELKERLEHLNLSLSMETDLRDDLKANLSRSAMFAWVFISISIIELLTILVLVL